MVCAQRRIFSLAIVMISMLGVSTVACADDASPSLQETIAKNIVITEGVLRPYHHATDRAAGYFTIRNTGQSDLLLDGVESSLCTRVTSNHTNFETVQATGKDNDDIFRHLVIPRQATMVFPASGYHLLCRGIRTMPKDGESVSFTFHFLNNGQITVPFTVQQASDKPRP